MRLPQSCSRIPIPISIILIIAFAILAVLPSAGAATKQLQFSPSNVRFGDIDVGQSQSQLVTLTNTGQSSVTISAVTAGNSGFTVSGLSLPVVLAASQTISFNVNFVPLQTGWSGANVTFTNTSSNPNLRLQVGGTGVSSENITAAPTSLSFGQVAVGASTTLPLVLTNTASWKVTLSALQAVGVGFSVSGPALPFVLNPGQSVSLSVAFAPQAPVVSGGSVFVSGPQLNIPLSGTGTATGQLGINPASLSFGSVDVGSSSTQPASLTATGGSVTINSASSSNSQYSIAGATFPLTINAGQSLSLNVVFAPTKSGTDNGTLTFNSTASNSQSTESLTGSGIIPQYTVDLSWTASTSSVAGYNVYRGTTAGSYSKINSSLDPTTTYSDSTVTSGVTYYYAATAVNSSGEESSYSTPIEVSVP